MNNPTVRITAIQQAMMGHRVTILRKGMFPKGTRVSYEHEWLCMTGTAYHTYRRKFCGVPPSPRLHKKRTRRQ